MYIVDMYYRVRRACRVEGDEHQGRAPGVGAAQRHRAQDAVGLGASRIPQGACPRRPQLEPYTDIIDRILEDYDRAPKQQRHTAKRIFGRLKAEHGFDATTPQSRTLLGSAGAWCARLSCRRNTLFALWARTQRRWGGRCHGVQTTACPRLPL